MKLTAGRALNGTDQNNLSLERREANEDGQSEKDEVDSALIKRPQLFPDSTEDDLALKSSIQTPHKENGQLSGVKFINIL